MLENKIKEAANWTICSAIFSLPPRHGANIQKQKYFSCKRLKKLKICGKQQLTFKRLESAVVMFYTVR